MGLFITIVAGIVVGGLLLVVAIENLEKIVLGAILVFGLVLLCVAALIGLAFWDYLGTIPNGRTDTLTWAAIAAVVGLLYWRAERKREADDQES